jgi:hypothetical protein
MSYDEPQIKYLEPDEATAKRNKKIDCMVMLIDRMRRRAAGRERMKAAEEKRRIKAAQRRLNCKHENKALDRLVCLDCGRTKEEIDAGILPRGRSVGTTEIEGDKPFYYKNGVLWKDGLGNHALEVIGRIQKSEQDLRETPKRWGFLWLR